MQQLASQLKKNNRNFKVRQKNNLWAEQKITTLIPARPNVFQMIYSPSDRDLYLFSLSEWDACGLYFLKNQNKLLRKHWKYYFGFKWKRAGCGRIQLNIACLDSTKIDCVEIKEVQFLVIRLVLYYKSSLVKNFYKTLLKLIL